MALFGARRALGAGAGGSAGWTVLALTLALAAGFPLLAIGWIAFEPSGDVWRHLVDTVLWRYVWVTLSLAGGVGLLTAAIGVGAGWLAATLDFPGRRAFEWALLLPLAMPAYIVGYVYADMLSFSGPIQGLLRAVFGWTRPQDYWFPETRTLGGAILLFSVALYPYVYVLARAAFLAQGAGPLEAARSLGAGPWRAFFRVALPLARPAVVAGAALAVMETMNDIGIPLYFGLPTFSVGVYDAWLHMGSAPAAAQLALAMLGLIALTLFAERYGRQGRGRAESGRSLRRAQRRRLTGAAAWLAAALCLLPVVLGFAAPALYLVGAALGHAEALDRFPSLATNSVLAAGAAAVAALLLALGLAYGRRLSPTPTVKGASRFATLGYGLPGTVLALGVLTPLAGFDNRLDGWARELFGFGTGLLLTGSIAALCFAYVVRFLALAFGAIEAGLERVTPSIDGAARTLGSGPWRVLARVHAPLLRGSVAAALIIVFVDCMKELPMTLLLRPFGFETLATHVYQYASAEQLEESALAALAIVVVGLAPIILLSRVMDPTKR